MGSCWVENPSTKRELAIKELEQGQECATQLQNLLREPLGEEQVGECLLVFELMEKIMTSFNETLSVLSVPAAHESAWETSNCQNIIAGSQVVNSGCYEDWRSQDTDETSRKNPTSAQERRGCYKRKKTLQSWTTLSSTIEDGRAWRKYGHKKILNFKFPRSYFRCRRKYDQGCKATKQVQRNEGDPQMYHITYIGHHTCKDILGDAQRISDSFSDPPGSYGAPTRGQDLLHPFTKITPLSFPTNANVVIKREFMELEAPSDVTDTVSSLDESNNLWKDLVPFNSAGDEPKLPSVYCSSSEAIICREKLDMDFVIQSFDFDCNFQYFNDSEFFMANELGLVG